MLGSIERSMAIQEHKKRTDLEKRLNLVREQVYGKQTTPEINYHQSNDSTQLSISYLRQDLIKILLLSSLAILGQIILFLTLKNHTLNINLF